MRRLMLVAALCSVACGPPEGAYQCEVDCLGRFSSDLLLDCDAVRSNFSRARSIIEREVVSADAFCGIYENLEVYVQNADDLDSDPGDGRHAYGRYNWNAFTDDYIELTRSCRSLVHELLHHWENVQGSVDEDHGSWYRTRYWYLDWEYKSEASPCLASTSL